MGGGADIVGGFVVQNQRSTGVNPAVAVISSVLLIDRRVR